MAIVQLKLPYGAKAQAKRDGYCFYKSKVEKFYRIKRKSNPKIVENNQHFARESKERSQIYHSLTDAEKEKLEERALSKDGTGNPWSQFTREYYKKKQLCNY